MATKQEKAQTKERFIAAALSGLATNLSIAEEIIALRATKIGLTAYDRFEAIEGEIRAKEAKRAAMTEALTEGGE